MQAGESVSFKFEVLTPNSGIHFGWEGEETRPRLVLNGSFSDSKRDDYDYTLAVQYDDKNLTSTFSSKVDDYRHTSNTYELDPSNPTAFNGNLAIPHAFTHTGPNRYSEVEHQFGGDYRILETDALLVDEQNQLLSPSSTVKYDYTGNGLVKGVTDPAGNTTTTEYDVVGRATGTTTPAIDAFVDEAVSPAQPDGIDDNPGVLEDATVESEYVLTEKTSTGEPGTEYDPIKYGPLDLSDQDFYHDFLEINTGTDENGVHTLTVHDARGNLRREAYNATDWGPIQPQYDRHVRYEYDLLNRLVSVLSPTYNPNDVSNPDRGVSGYHETTYTYNKFGRVQYKSQPDMGTTSYAYDKVGNVRYTQTEQQDDDQKLTFYQYDDLNRLTLVGEAEFAYNPHPPGTEIEGDDEKGVSLSSTGGRLTDQLEDQAHYLHLDVGSSSSNPLVLTYNPTVWMPIETTPPPHDPTAPPPLATPRVQDELNNNLNVEMGCQLSTVTIFDEMPPNPPYLTVGNVKNWDPVVGSPATLDDFEHVARYPQHVRMAVHYDELPDPTGEVWGGFPSHSKWHKLMPKRPDWFDEDNNPNTAEIQQISNLKGRESAVAYRDHSGEPYHYTVTSYDPRGRVEAVIHYTENVGFDAVYYKYNSMNLITEVRTIDPFRQHTTWYGYDHNGRLDSVWTKLSDDGTGFAGTATGNYPWLNTPRYPTYHDEPRPDRDQADIVYTYDERGFISKKQLQPGNDNNGMQGLNVTTNYVYNDRGWMTGMHTTQSSGNLFDMTLEYDQTGQIRKQTSQQGGNTPFVQNYDYDEVRQLKVWWRDKGGANETSDFFDYDLVGNRRVKSAGPTGTTLPHNDWYTYFPGTEGANRLKRVNKEDLNAQLIEQLDYTYDMNGAIATRTLMAPSSIPGVQPYYEMESFAQSYRGLLWKYGKSRSIMNNTAMSVADDWRYRYNPSGEREGRRLYNDMNDDGVSPYPWTYYLLDGRSRQFAVWNGQQTSDPMLCPTTPIAPGTSTRFMYATEYLAFGVGNTADVVIAPDAIKTYKVSDHLGSTRAEIVEGGVMQNWDYEPYGGAVAGDPPRKGFIDREEDKESALGDFGVRKYDEDIGRFLSVDPLWEKYRAWSPYQYSVNNPALFIDPSGKDAEVIVDMDKGTIDVIAKIYIYGPDASSTVAGNIETEIGGNWNSLLGHFYTDSEGNVYRVTFKVTVEVYNPSDPTDGPDIISDRHNPWSTNNYIEIDNSVKRSYVRLGDEGKWTSTIYGVATHEFGHLIGLKDRYTDNSSGVGSTPHTGWKTNIMGTLSGSVQQKNIDGIFDNLLGNDYYRALNNYNNTGGIPGTYPGAVFRQEGSIFKTKIDEAIPSW